MAGAKHMRLLLDIRPAIENTLSTLAEPLGMLNMRLAICESCGSTLEFSFQKRRTSSTSVFNLGIPRYCSTSPLTSSVVEDEQVTVAYDWNIDLTFFVLDGSGTGSGTVTGSATRERDVTFLFTLQRSSV